MSEKKEYTNGEVTLMWEPTKCIHAAQCVANASGVFKPREKPWVQMDGDTTENIVSAVRKCPSGALSIKE